MTDQPENEHQEMTLEQCQTKAEEYLSGWRRAMADYQNREKELAKEKEESARSVTMYVLSDILPVLDNLRQAFTHVPPDQKEVGWVKGIGYIIKQFEDVLAKYNVRPFETLGLPFDASRHDAVGSEEGETPGMIVREVATGYEMNGRVIRPAKVVVSQTAEKEI